MPSWAGKDSQPSPPVQEALNRYTAYRGPPHGGGALEATFLLYDSVLSTFPLLDRNYPLPSQGCRSSLWLVCFPFIHLLIHSLFLLHLLRCSLSISCLDNQSYDFYGYLYAGIEELVVLFCAHNVI